MFSLRNINEKILLVTKSGYTITEKQLPNAFYEYFPNAHILHNSQHYTIDHMERDRQTNTLSAIVTQVREKFDYKTKIRPIVEKKVFTNKQSDTIEFISDIEVKVAECKIQLEYQGNEINYREQVLMESYNYEILVCCIIFNFEDIISTTRSFR